MIAVANALETAAYLEQHGGRGVTGSDADCLDALTDSINGAFGLPVCMAEAA